MEIDSGGELDRSAPANYRLIDNAGNVIGRRRCLNHIEAVHWAIKTWRTTELREVSLQTEDSDGRVIHRLAIGPFTMTNF